jgi:hypothetical protein
MVLLDRSEVRTIPLDVYFSLKIHFKLEFFKLLSVWVPVRVSPGFPLGGRFPAEQNTYVVLCMNRIPPEQKTGFPRCSAYFKYQRSKHQTVCSKRNSLLSGNPNTAEATHSGSPSFKQQ